MLNGLDLFSGIGGITIALQQWVKPLAYCEADKYAQGVLLSRMADGRLPYGPIWDYIETFPGKEFAGLVDIIYGGFPCQDISAAGLGKGLEGERSKLFFEIVRLINEIRPTFVFLENVPAITTKGLGRVLGEISACGYDCRWNMLRASDVGAPHKRERWFLLAYAPRTICDGSAPATRRTPNGSADASYTRRDVSDSDSNGVRNKQIKKSKRPGQTGFIENCKDVPDSDNTRCKEQRCASTTRTEHATLKRRDWWSVEPDVGRVVNGLPFRVDRIKGLGNAVVPSQAEAAFKRLMYGILR